MLVGLCSVFDLISLVPYIWLITLPLYGAFCGTEACARLSIIMCLYAGLTSALPSNMGILSAIINFSILFTLLFMPIHNIPHVLVIYYHHSLWISELLLLFIDCIQFVHASMTISYTLVADYMEYSPKLIKMLMLSVSAVCYMLASWYGYSSWSSNAQALYWYLPVFLLVVCILLVTAHCFMYTFEEGIITDTAAVSFMSLLMLNVFYHNMSYSKHPLRIPQNWHREDDVLSLSSIHLLYKMTTYNIGQAQLSVQFITKMLNPSYIILFLVRLYSIIASALQIINNYMYDLVEDMSLVERVLSSRVFLHVTIVFVYTQSVASHLQISTNTGSWCHTTLIQAIALPIYYMYQLYKVEVSGWNEDTISKTLL